MFDSDWLAHRANIILTKVTYQHRQDDKRNVKSRVFFWGACLLGIFVVWIRWDIKWLTDRIRQTDSSTTEEACSKASSLGVYLVLAKQQICHVFFFICPCDEQKIILQNRYCIILYIQHKQTVKEIDHVIICVFTGLLIPHWGFGHDVILDILIMFMHFLCLSSSRLWSETFPAVTVWERGHALDRFPVYHRDT